MADSIKKRLLATIETTLGELKTANLIRTLKVSRFQGVTAAPCPYIHAMAGEEVNLEDAEDFRGYTLQFPLHISILIDCYQTNEDILRDLEQAVQVKIETDLTVGGLAMSVLYMGDVPFTSLERENAGGNELRYLVTYRRAKADPSSGY